MFGFVANTCSKKLRQYSISGLETIFRCRENNANTSIESGFGRNVTGIRESTAVINLLA